MKKISFSYLCNDEKDFTSILCFTSLLKQKDVDWIKKQLPAVLQELFFWEQNIIQCGAQDISSYYDEETDEYVYELTPNSFIMTIAKEYADNVIPNIENLSTSEISEFAESIIENKNIQKKFYADFYNSIETIHSRFPIATLLSGIQPPATKKQAEWDAFNCTAKNIQQTHADLNPEIHLS